MKRKYPGGKNAPGTYQQIINLIPPHDVFVEPFVGSGAVFINKRPADINVVNDINPRIAAEWEHYQLTDGKLIVHCDDAIEVCNKYQALRRSFVYLDPPYLYSTRRGGQRKIYLFEAGDEEYHEKLILWALEAKCMVLISGYDHYFYNQALSNWNTHSWQVRTRVGYAIEKVWYNYPTPVILHDDSYLGRNFREREKIKLKRQRWINRFSSLDEPVRVSILSELNRQFLNHI